MAKQVMTHSGLFHADEVFGTLILEKIFGELEITRTFRVPEGLPEDVIVYDIGGGKFDHHQKGKAVRENGIPYAACGLLWEEYGYDICGSDEVKQMVERDLIMGIDALDNGVQIVPSDALCHVANVYDIIRDLNPTWDSEEAPDDAFIRALAFARPILDFTLKNAKSKYLAKSIMEDAIDFAENGIMVLDQFIPFPTLIFESDNAKAKSIMFAVFPSKRGGWNMQCIPDTPNSLGQRKSVPKEWKGAKADELQKMTGVETVTFCHPSGFLSATGTKEDAIKLALLAMEA